MHTCVHTPAQIVQLASVLHNEELVSSLNCFSSLARVVGIDNHQHRSGGGGLETSDRQSSGQSAMLVSQLTWSYRKITAPDLRVCIVCVYSGLSMYAGAVCIYAGAYVYVCTGVFYQYFTIQQPFWTTLVELCGFWGNQKVVQLPK